MSQIPRKGKKKKKKKKNKKTNKKTKKTKNKKKQKQKQTNKQTNKTKQNTPIHYKGGPGGFCEGITEHVHHKPCVPETEAQTEKHTGNDRPAFPVFKMDSIATSALNPN